MKLYINKDKCRYYVDVVINSNYLKRHKQLACFRSYKSAHRGRIGTITLRSDADTATAAHELVHAALYFIQAYASEEIRKLDNVELDDYIHESAACVVENMLRQYLTKTR